MKGLPAAFFLTALALSTRPVQANPLLINLPADSWYEVPNSKMRAVCAGETEFPGIRGSSGCAQVMASWSGGAYDAGRKRMWIWGGGHGDYWGNELYAFDVETLKWSRVNDPSPVDPAKLSADPMPDGRPVARHTYDGLAFIGPADRLFAYGGSMAGNGYGTTVTWAFDPVSGKWEDRAPAGAANHPQTNCCDFSGEYDPVGGLVYLRDPNWLCAYDYRTNAWSHVREWSHSWGPGKGVIDTKRRLLFTIGSGEFLVYDIASGKDVSADWKTTGGDSLINGYGGGAAYAAEADKIVGWIGGGVYALDMGTRVWKRMSGTGAPAAQLEWGTYGRFRYVPGDNVFILMNGVDDNVRFYKLEAGGYSSLLDPARGKSALRASHVPAGARSAEGRARPLGTGVKPFPASPGQRGR